MSHIQNSDPNTVLNPVFEKNVRLALDMVRRSNKNKNFLISNLKNKNLNISCLTAFRFESNADLERLLTAKKTQTVKLFFNLKKHYLGNIFW
jgi:hypothetical protein